MRLENGLDLSELVPKNTPEHSFLEAQAKHFGYYDFYAVTKVSMPQHFVAFFNYYLCMMELLL